MELLKTFLLQHLNLMLFFTGLGTLSIGGLLFLYKFLDKKAMGIVTPLIVLLGLALSISGASLQTLYGDEGYVHLLTSIKTSTETPSASNPTTPAPQEQDASPTHQDQASSPTLPTQESSSANQAQETSPVTPSPSHSSPTKSAPFDPKDSVVPIIDNNDIIDADGSKVIGYDLFITPEGIRYHVKWVTLTAMVSVPQGKTSSEGTHYKNYELSHYSFTDLLTEYDFVAKDEYDMYEDYTLHESKSYDYDKDTFKNNMDFIYKFIPVNNPNTTVKNDFLNGTYYYKEVTPLEVRTHVTLTLLDDQFLEMDNAYTSDIKGLYGYKLEPLGKNAYKLYLYPASVKATTNQSGGVSLASDPLKKTFLIYRTGSDTFDLVFIGGDDKPQRISLPMSK
ncbi:Hypothetical protein DPCES_5018 [Desulfitobacterium hafniense]|uniref:Uncharacterized protein n=1 Tax=Desulfitobacterium hafniense TaxID=49338 RepID=A0A098B7R5_DESHA|nr:hypothetical protein [Desulfitobacterium hafniense]CDX04904.1 Hypothetical protein DPCES_5018 [Desulfitobacterium hafniense]